MGNCPNCGAELTEGIKFCPNCGKAVEQKPPVTTAEQKTVTSPMQKTPSVTTGKSKKSSKSYLKIGCLSIVIIIVLIIVIVSITSKSSYKSTSPYNFKQEGYFKDEDKFRIFSYQVVGLQKMSIDSIPNNVWQIIKEHGSNQMHTVGSRTGVFYFFDNTVCPADPITLPKSWIDACNNACKFHPFAAIWIEMNEETKLIKDPCK